MHVAHRVHRGAHLLAVPGRHSGGGDRHRLRPVAAVAAPHLLLRRRLRLRALHTRRCVSRGTRLLLPAVAAAAAAARSRLRAVWERSPGRSRDTDASNRWLVPHRRQHHTTGAQPWRQRRQPLSTESPCKRQRTESLCRFTTGPYEGTERWHSSLSRQAAVVARAREAVAARDKKQSMQEAVVARGKKQSLQERKHCAMPTVPTHER